MWFVCDGEQYLVLWVKANQMSSSENTKKECGIKIGSQADSATEMFINNREQLLGRLLHV